VVYIVSILTSTSRGPSAIAELFVLLVTASVVRVMFFSGKKELIDLIRTYLPFKATSTSTCPLTAAGHFRLTSCDGWPRNYHVMYADLRYFFLDSRYMWDTNALYSSHLGLYIETERARVTLITHAFGCRVGRVFNGVYVFVCVHVFHTPYKHKNLTQNRSTMSLGNPFILGSKGQGSRSRSRCTKTMAAWVVSLLWVPVFSYLHCDWCIIVYASENVFCLLTFPSIQPSAAKTIFL